MSNNFKPLTDQVSERLREQLTKDRSVFQSGGDKALAMPYNPVSGKSYRGAAGLILLMEQREDPRWLSLKQASYNKTPVRKDEHGTLISFYKNSEMKPVLLPTGEPALNENNKPKYEAVKLDEAKLETAFMFNAEQLKDMPELQPRHELSGADRLQQIIDHVGAELSNEYVTDQLVEHVAVNIKLPELDEDKTRLRNQIANLFISAELGLPYQMPDYTFVVNTPDLLKKEPAELFKAANDAQKIADHVLGFEKKRELEQKTATRLNKDDEITYKGDTYKVLQILKGKTAQLENSDGHKFKVSPKDGLYAALVEAKNNPQQEKVKKQEPQLEIAR